jgi:predicted metal-dependent enzyme (double-stranded beta helix superfamily)
MGFDVQSFVASCIVARSRPNAPEAIASLVREAIADPLAVAMAVRERRGDDPEPPMLDVFHTSEALTIYHEALPPYLFGVPHDHATWAVIGVYEGAEACNIYRETPSALSRVRYEELFAPALRILPPDMIHDVENRTGRTAGSIHVYGNRHFDLPERRIWRTPAGKPEPFSGAKAFEWGMELTRRRRHELGVEDASTVAPREAISGAP